MKKRELKQICDEHPICSVCPMHHTRVRCAYGTTEDFVVPMDYPDNILDEEVDYYA